MNRELNESSLVATPRQEVEKECIDALNNAIEEHGVAICAFLGISPTMDRGLTLWKLYIQYKGERIH